MNIESFRSYCLAFPETTESFPFDEQTLVFKVANKMFALTNVDNFVSANLKCDPDEAEQLRERYHAVQPGYHMSKKHWNTVEANHDVNDLLFEEMVKKSYLLVVNGLKKADKERVLSQL